MDNKDHVLYLTSVLPPSVNHYLGYRGIIKNGKPMAVSYCTNEAKKYKSNFSEYVKEQVNIQNWDLEPNKTQHFYVDSVYYFPATNLDCNNYFKCMLDAITDTQLIWLDDNVTCERVQRIYYDSDNPRIELEIKPVDYIGIFDNVSHLEKFESKCAGCTRYKRNCSVLKNAKEGKVSNIKGIINNNECSKYKGIKEKRNGKE